METFKSKNIQQKKQQHFSDFETELRTHFSFGSSNASVVKLKDIFLFGVSDKKLQFRLLAEDKSASDMIELCKAREAAYNNKQLLEIWMILMIGVIGWKIKVFV